MDRTQGLEEISELSASIRWLTIDGIGQARLRSLRRRCGGSVAALESSASELSEALQMPMERADRLRTAARAAEVGGIERAFESMGARGVFEESPEYPMLLRATPDPPGLLFVRGVLDAAPEPAVAIVGSRRATTYGRLHAGRIAIELAERGVVVVSGGARGIDAEAHRGALRGGGRTIAVLATGIDRPYPAEHAELFDAIVEAGGCTLTEQLPGVSARPDLFPRRNRMIAALSLVTVVVEAASRSGALLTARIAVDDLSREAACLPGPVDSAVSEGCHRAIREGWAHLVTGAEDICRLLQEARPLAEGAVEHAAREDRKANRGEPAIRRVRRDPSAPAPPGSRTGHVSRGGRPESADASSVLDAVRAAGGAGLDELERALGWSVPRIACATLELEVGGWIVRRTDGAFAVVRGGGRAESTSCGLS